MTIHLTEAPEGVIPHQDVHDRFDLDRHTLALTLEMGDRRVGAIALTLLETMGKRLDITGGNSVRQVEHIDYAPFWAQAHNLTEVAVLNAQSLTTAMVRNLHQLLPGVRLTGICEPGTARRATASLRWDSGEVIPLPWDEFDHAHPHVAAVEEEAAADPYGIPDLPYVDFLTFRATTRSLTTPEVFTAVDADYRQAYLAATAVEPTLDALIEHLDAATWDARSTAPLVVAIRATQAALFTRGWLMKVRTDQLLGTLTSVRHPRPTDRDWRALRAYIRPERSATTALYLLGTPAATIPDITIADIDQALTNGHLNGHRIPTLATPLLHAELLRRRSEGQPDHAPYVRLPPGNPRRHMEFIIDARRDLHLPIDGRQIRNRTYSHSTRTLNSLGIDLRSLT